jgi:hypothetical protein
MATKNKILFRALWIAALPSYVVFLISVVLICTERFAFKAESVVPFYVVVGLVYFSLFVCYVMLLGDRDSAPVVRRRASIIAFTAAIAFAVSFKTIPPTIPAP